MSKSPDHPKDNREAIARDLSDSMTRAGIGRHYHDAGLTEFGEFGAAFKARILGNLFYELESGTNLRLTGKRSYDFTIVAARALLLSSWTVRVTTPTKIAAMFDDKRYSEIEELSNVKSLVILSFNESGECPYSPWLRRRMEGLFSDRLETSRSMIMQSETIRGPGWWSVPFMDRLDFRTEKLEVRS